MIQHTLFPIKLNLFLDETHVVYAYEVASVSSDCVMLVYQRDYLPRERTRRNSLVTL